MSRSSIQLQRVKSTRLNAASTANPFANIPTDNDNDVAKAQRQSLEAAVAASSVSKTRRNIVIGSVTCVTALSAFLAGVITVAIPAMARDVNLDQGLLLWYV